MTSNLLPDGWTANDFVGDDFEAHLRHLMANAMRVARGSGRPHDVPRQLLDCVVALKNYQAKNDACPSGIEIARALYVIRGYDRETGYRPNPDVEDIVSGALQMAAARLVAQSQQEHLGRSTVLQAVRHGNFTSG